MVTEGARAEPFDRKERMATNNPYQVLVEGFARLLSDGQALSPLAGYRYGSCGNKS